MFWALIFTLLLFFILGSFAYATLSAAPWLPLSKKDVARMIRFANIKDGELVYDLGCGDARLLIEAVKNNHCKAIGFEISFLMYIISQLRVLFSGQSKNISIKFKSFYGTSLVEADVIFTFLTPYAMNKLKDKVERELHSGARLLSYAFSIKGLTPKLIHKENENVTSIFLYSLNK